MKTIAPVLTVFAAVALLACTATSQEGSTKAETPDSQMFKDRVITVYVDDPMKGSGQVLRNADLKEVGGRWMLIGEVVTSNRPGEWADGLTVGVAWETVTAFYLFTEEQFDDKMSDAAKF